MDFTAWFMEAIPWVFSGIGVFIIGLFIKNKAVKMQKQRISKGSFGIQVGGNIEVNKEAKSGYPKPKRK